MHTRSVTLGIVSLLLISCAGVSPAALRPSSTQKTIHLSSPIEYRKYYGLVGNLFVYTLAEGDYYSKYEDRSGTYFEGTGQCFQIRIVSDALTKKGEEQPEPHSYRCGVHIPVEPKSPPRIYFYRDPEISNAIMSATKSEGTLIAAFDAAELKNLHFYQDQPPPEVLRSALKKGG